MASGWLTMTNILKRGYSPGTKPLSSLNRVGRITSILLLLGKQTCWVQLESETLLSALPGRWSHSLKCVCGQKRASLYIYFCLTCLLTCVSESLILLWDLCRLQRQQSHDSLLSLTKKLTKVLLKASVQRWFSHSPLTCWLLFVLVSHPCSLCEVSK